MHYVFYIISSGDKKLKYYYKKYDFMTFGRQSPYSIDNKLDQLIHKMFNTTLVSTKHMGYTF